MGNAKIKNMKITCMHNINTNTVRGRLSKNYLARKFIVQKNILTRNICNLRYIDKMTISLFLLLTVVD